MTARAAFPALGTSAVVAVTDPPALAAAREAVARELAAVDRACSRFRDDSDLSACNRAAGRATAVGAYLLEALRVALRVAAATGGLVDPTVGRAVRLAGYDCTFSLVRDRDGSRLVPRAAPARGWGCVALDEVHGTVRIPEGVELDLGATAKALAADRAAVRAAAAAGCGVLVSLGGDIAVAGPPPEGGWPVRVADDHAAPLDGDGPVVTVSSGGLASSGTAVRRWRAAAGEAHHLVDPSTGLPAATPWRTVSVAAASCVDANAAATAAVVLGDGAEAWLDARRLPARLVRVDGSVAAVAGWPA